MNNKDKKFIGIYLEKENLHILKKFILLMEIERNFKTNQSEVINKLIKSHLSTQIKTIEKQQNIICKSCNKKLSKEHFYTQIQGGKSFYRQPCKSCYTKREIKRKKKV